jgi:hypothetical protein
MPAKDPVPHIPAEPYHVGIVTRDLHEGMAAVGALFGLRWTRIVDIDADAADFTTAIGAPLDWRVIGIAHSTGGPMHVELLQGAPGSVWYTDEPAVLHHYAYWVDDIAKTMDVLKADGWACEVTRFDEAGKPAFAYMTKAGAPRVELSDVSRRAAVLAKLRS